MGLLKRLLARGLSGADSPPPPDDSPIRVRGAADETGGQTIDVTPPEEKSKWPPGPPPIARLPDGHEIEKEADYGLERWRHPVLVDRKELWESGFEFCGAAIKRAFETNGQSVVLEQTDDTLLINEVEISRSADDVRYLEITHTKTSESFSLAEPTWAVAVALHDAYLEPLDPDRSWQIGVIDEVVVLFLARPEEIAAIGRRSPMAIVADLARLSPG